MPRTAPSDSSVALDAILAAHMQKLSETWPGDESLVGILLHDRAGNKETTAIVWAPRERVLKDLTGRRDAEQDPRRRARYDEAIAFVDGARVPQSVSLVVSGWGDFRTVALDAGDLRIGKRLTTTAIGRC